MEKKQFIDDITIKGALTGILLRSPVESGLLKEIITPKLPYNVSLVTAADIPGLNVCSVEQNGQSGDFFENPVFPIKELCWHGQPVAMLLGPNSVKLRELAKQCVILAEEQGKVAPLPKEKTIVIERNYSAGSVDEAFEKAATVVEGRYCSGIQDPWPSDPPGAIAIPGPGDFITIHTATQWPGHVRSSVARCLNIKNNLVNVELSRLEVHLDSKIWSPSLLACQAAVGARLRGKPIKLILRRDEDFFFSPKSARAEIHIKSALNKQGAILGTKTEISVDFGAFDIFSREILDRIALTALGAYNHGSIELRGQGWRNFIPSAGPVTGFGLVQGFFAAERHASRIAETMGVDPAEWRKNFFLRKGKKLAIGTEIKNPPMEELIDSAQIMSDYRRKWAAYELLRKNRRENPPAEHRLNEPLRGVGISLAYQGNSLLYDFRTEELTLTLKKDGVLEIHTALPCGDNQIRIWHILASKMLGVEEVHLIPQDGKTAKNIAESGPACLSRNINVITELIEKACMAIRKQRFRNPLPITVSRYYRPSKIHGWTNLEIIDENALSSLSWGSAVVETEINPVSFIPKVRGIWLCVDGGTILSEERAKISISTASLTALSWAMQEQVVYRNGKIDKASIYDYSVRIEEAPPISVDFLWSEGKSRGIGELPFALVPAAYTEALSQALDHPFDSFPADPKDIWKAAQKFSTGAEP